MVRVYGLILLSVLLTAGAQILLKVGMSSSGVQGAITDGRGLLGVVFAVATQPYVIAGLFAFGLSAITWLFVLAKVDVSLAYPAVALGIVLTSAAGYFLLGESISPVRAVGIGLIVTGVVTIAAS